MNKGLGSYIGSLAVTFALIALFPSELSMWIGAMIFVFPGTALPLGINFLVGGIAVAIFALFSADMALGALMALSYVLTGMVEGICIRKQLGYGSIVTIGTVTRLISTGFYYYYCSRIGNTTVKGLILDGVPEAFREYMNSVGYPIDERIIEETVEYMGAMLPSVLCITALAFAFFTFAGAMFVLKRRHIGFAWIKPFKEIKMDRIVTVFYILIFVAGFMTEGNIQIILLNAVYVLTMVYAVCGVAALVRIIKEKVKSRGLGLLLTVLPGFLTAGFLYPLLGIAASIVRKD